jgi:hypothetical protein
MGEGMSGSSSKSETGDVLASIRRVIAEEVSDNEMARAPTTNPSGGERLVLGPALRVPTSDDEYDIKDSLVMAEPRSTGRRYDRIKRSSQTAELAIDQEQDNYNSGSGGAWEEEKISAVGPWSEVAPAKDREDGTAEAPITELTLQEETVLDDNLSSGSALGQQSPDNFGSGGLLGQAGAEMTGGGVTDQEKTNLPVSPVVSGLQTDRQLPTSTAAVSKAHVPEARSVAAPKAQLRAPEPAEPRKDPSKLEAKITALETLVARSKGQWEPDRTGKDGNAAHPDVPMTWEPSEEEQAIDPRGPARNPPPPPVLGQNGDMDEAKFRQFVVDIVREEIKGQLDIRMNRLVRNIVGREIKRAIDKDGPP